MTHLSRVVWAEGMHLAQHHFQAQSRYFEELTGFALSTLFFRPWGLAAGELDPEALLNGTVSLVHARGIMPDGLSFNFPGDAFPEPLQIAELFSPTQETQDVLLAIPAYRPAGANVDGSGRARFAPATLTVADEITGADEKSVQVARRSFRLLLDDQVDEGLVTLPIARVRRDGSGHFVYDPAYVPPCIQIGASDRLMRMLARLVEMLGARADALRAERSAGPTASQGTREVVSFWLSHAIHASLPALRHHFRTGGSHPEELYTDMARLAGALGTFSLAADPGSLSEYRHEDLTATFDALEREIEGRLEVVLPTNSLVTPLTPADQYLYAATVADPRCYAHARWFLAVRSSASVGEVLERVPRLVKVCSSKHIIRLVREAHPGLTLEHVPTPPSAVSPRIGAEYFAIQQAGPCWTSIADTHQVGVYVPAAIPDAELELAVVFES